MSKIKIGTASWSEGKIPYPSWCRSPKDKLGFYSARFPMVEVDSTHYAIHTPETIASWVEYTPKDFVFNVKVFGLFTLHWTQPKFLPVFIREKLSTSLANRSGLYYRDMPRKLKDRLWETFDAMLEPLLNSRKLDVVILQFSSGFIPGPSSLRHLEECRARLSKYKVAVEFRNRAWFEGGQHKRTFEFLERNNLLYVAVDGPQELDSSVPRILGGYGDRCVVRFHGRNRKGWMMRGPEAKKERANYVYAEEELEEWVRKIREIEGHVDEVHLVMNTIQAMANAGLMAKLLGQELTEGSSPSPRKQEFLRSAAPANTACVLIDHFPLRQEIRRAPALKKIPAIVYRLSGSKQSVLDFSPQLEGVRQGMPLPEALSQAKAANLIEADIPFYDSAFEKVLEALESKSPVVESSTLGCAYVGLKGLEGIYGGEAQMINTLMNLPPEGEGVRVGVAQGKFPAYIAAMTATPGRAVKVPDQVHSFLQAVPIEMLPISWDMQKQLHSFSLHTLGQIACLRPESLESQFGPKGRIIWELSNGIDKTPITPTRREEAIIESLIFADPVYAIQPVLVAIETLLKRAFSSTQLNGKAVRVFTLEAQTMRGHRWSHRMTFKEPVADPSRAFKLIRDAPYLRSLSGPLEELSLTLTGITSDRGQQLNMFTEVRQRERLNNALRHLEARLGEKAPIFQVREMEPWSRIPERRQGLVQYAL